jgi:hypothetical protein
MMGAQNIYEIFMTRIIGLAALLALVSCASRPYQPYAREVKKKSGVEGVIALKTEHVPAERTYADSLMSKNCGTNPVNVLEEREVAVGSTTTSNSQARNEKEDNGFNMGGFKFSNWCLLFHSVPLIKSWPFLIHYKT